MPLSVSAQRLGYRVAYRLLQLFWFVCRPETEGVKCVLTHADEVLLVRHTYGPAVWDLPGGGVKRGESPLQAAEREMAEELGLREARWRPAGTIHGRQNLRRDTVHCFHADLATRTVAPDPVELAQARWYARSALPAPLGLYVTPALGGLCAPG